MITTTRIITSTTTRTTTRTTTSLDLILAVLFEAAKAYAVVSIFSGLRDGKLSVVQAFVPVTGYLITSQTTWYLECG